MSGPAGSKARALMEAAEVEIAEAAVEDRAQMIAIHFAGSAMTTYVLRQASSLPEHHNTLTEDEYEAVGVLRDGKKLTSKMLSKEVEGELAGGGLVATAEAVAALCEELGVK